MLRASHLKVVPSKRTLRRHRRRVARGQVTAPIRSLALFGSVTSRERSPGRTGRSCTRSPSPRQRTQSLWTSLLSLRSACSSHCPVAFGTTARSRRSIDRNVCRKNDTRIMTVSNDSRSIVDCWMRFSRQSRFSIDVHEVLARRCVFCFVVQGRHSAPATFMAAEEQLTEACTPLPQGNMFTDPGIWICFDEVCNSKASNAEQGFDWVRRRTSGALGRAGREPGCHALFLSDESQARMRYAKGTREVRAHLKGCDDVLDVYRTEENVACFSHF